MNYAVIGSNYGDEGKGLAVDYLASQSKRPLVVKHNGGAQAGHTVELSGKRFVFHELSSGSFRSADTYWAKTFFPDLFKLREEIDSFKEVAGFVPSIYAAKETQITIIDDVLINMLSESLRGEHRHGSCGMGIYAAKLRTEAGFSLTVKDVLEKTLDELVAALLHIREVYSLKVVKELGAHEKNQYYELLKDSSVIENFAIEIHKNAGLVTIITDEKKFFEAYTDIIFEGGQGLRLDTDLLENYPHVSASKTGLCNPVAILKENGMQLDKALYVSRGYLTRHGAGPLKHEISKEGFITDITNVYNEWQGSIRYATFESKEEFLNLIKKDLESVGDSLKAMLLFTHLNETGNTILFSNRSENVVDITKDKLFRTVFSEVLTSDTYFSKDIKIMK